MGKGPVYVVIGLICILPMIVRAGFWVSLPAANIDNQNDPCGGSNWTLSSFFYDSQNSGSNTITGSVPRGEYTTDIRFFFCTGYVETVPQGSYCFLQTTRNSGNCPSGFVAGTRTHDDEDTSRKTNGEQIVKIDILTTTVVFHFCCGSGQSSTWDVFRDNFPSQFIFFRKSGTCLSIQDRTLSEGSILVNDEDSSNINAVSGTLPDGVYNSNTQYQYCSYSSSSAPFPTNQIDVIDRNSTSITIQIASALNTEVYRISIVSGSTTINSVDSSSLTHTFIDLSASTPYTIRVFSGGKLGGQTVYEQKGYSLDSTTCGNGYQGLSCNQPICPQGCFEGKCILPNQCNCTTGWTGTSCSDCGTNFFPLEGKCEQCTKNCNFGRCNDGKNGDGSCICNIGYATIPSNSTDYCNQCANGFFFDGKSCTPCDQTCATCSQPAKCLSCKTGLTLDGSTGKCNSSCDEGLFNKNGICTQCDSSCETCIEESRCLSCKSEFPFLNTLCGKSCNPGSYPDSSQICRPCSIYCRICSGANNNQCSECVEDFYLNSTTCLDFQECSKTGFPFEGKCIRCDDSCQTCNGETANDCLSCPFGTFLNLGKCEADCPEGTFKENFLRTCQSCTQPCSVCSGSSINDCNGCASPFHLYGSTCVRDCPIGFFLNQTANRCDPCQLPCLTCSQSPDFCLNCEGNKLLHQGTCVDSCPQRYFNSLSRCRQCSESCGTCDGISREFFLPGTFCLTCSNSSHFLIDGQCFAACPGTLLQNGTCLKQELKPTEMPTEVAPTEPPTEKPEESKSNGGTIAGAVIGSLLFLILIIIGLFYFLRYKKISPFKKSVSPSAVQLEEIEEIPQIPKDNFVSRKVSIAEASRISEPGSETLLNTQINVALPGFLQLDFTKHVRQEKQIGSGGNGVLYYGILLDPTLVSRFQTEQIVIKYVQDVDGMSQENNQTFFENEVSINWALCYHDNIAKIVGYCNTPRCIIMKLYEKDLFAFIRNPNEEISPARSIHLAEQVIKGLAAIHKFNAAHRDIKSKNILIERGLSERDSDIRAVICDFGLAMIEKSFLVTNKYTDLIGLSPKYASPEVFEDSKKEKPSLELNIYQKADIFAFGVVLWELITRQIPWHNTPNEIVRDNIMDGKRLEMPKIEDKGMYTLSKIAEECWQQDPSKRPAAASIHSKISS